MKNRCFPIVFAAIFALLSALANAQDSTKAKNFYADGVSVKSYDFNAIRSIFEKTSDTTYVINFWATWCGPCVQELPHFEKINSEMSQKPVKVILISLDFSKQIEKSLLPFIKRKNLKSTVLHLNDPDANSWIGDVDENWTGAIPATLIYNPKKKLRKFHEGSLTYEELQTELKPFL